MWDWFIGLLATILGAIVNVVGDWGLAIIIFTVLIRLALTPLSLQQIRATAKMSVLQPKMQEIQTLYADDPNKMSEEMTKLYSEAGANPLGGCLPVLLQMPIFFALFSVLRDLPKEACFYNILPMLAMSPAEALGNYGPGLTSGIYIAFDVLFGILTFVPMLLTNMSGNEENRGQTMMMGAVMAIMMVWVGWRIPAGVLLYYDVSSGWGVIQQLFVTNRVREKILAEEEARTANEIKVNVVRKEKKQRPRKKN